MMMTTTMSRLSENQDDGAWYPSTVFWTLLPARFACKVHKLLVFIAHLLAMFDLRNILGLVMETGSARVCANREHRRSAGILIHVRQ